MEQDFRQEFEVRFTESSTIARQVAFAVLRHSEDAEEIAQETFAWAYRNFSQLQDRDRFRIQLVRMTWWMANDRQRSDRSRVARERVSRTAALSQTAEQVVIEQERVASLGRAIRTLPEKLRSVVVLGSIEEY